MTAVSAAINGRAVSAGARDAKRVARCCYFGLAKGVGANLERWRNRNMRYENGYELCGFWNGCAYWMKVGRGRKVGRKGGGGGAGKNLRRGGGKGGRLGGR